MKQRIFYLYAGFLSFMCAEVFSGASVNWIIEPWSWIVTYPLYMFHFFFFCNLAVITKRKSFGALYLWGMVFALYETWITKVVWTGYFAVDGYAFGGALGFGFHETFGLLFFFHPIASFLIPLTVLSLIFPSIGREFPLPDWLFVDEKRTQRLRIGLILLFGIVTGHNLPNLGAIVLTWIPTLLVCYAGYRFFAVKGEGKETLKLPISRAGLIVSGAFVLFFSIAGYFLLLPERIPEEGFVQLKTVLIYMAVFYLIYRKPSDTPSPYSGEVRVKTMWNSLLRIAGICLLLGVIKTFYPAFIYVLAMPIFIAFIPIGIFLFLRLGLARTR